MSKSRGNVVNPDEVREIYGADATRLYICFLGPFDKDKPWATTGIDGVKRFLDRTWRLVVDDEGKTLPPQDEAPPEALNKLLHKTIKKVGDDLENLQFNTAISAMMILVNEMYAQNVRPRAILKPWFSFSLPSPPM